MHISGDYSESPSSDDEDYMAGWNSALQKGTNEMKITKSQLAQIVQEEMSNVLEEADIASLQKELMTAVGAIVDAYEGIKLPPPVADLEAMIEAGNLLQAHHDITDMWNGLLMYHRDSGIRMPSHAVVTNFNDVNTLLRKVPDSVGGQVGQRTPQRPIDRDKDGNRIPVYEEANEIKITKSKLAQIVQEELKATLSEGNPHLYDNVEEHALDALRLLDGEATLGDIAEEAGPEWAREEWDDSDGQIDRDDWRMSVAAAMDNLVAAGRVSFTQGEPGDEDFYSLAQ
jgi:uncharacterized membrane protein YgcG